MALIPGAGTLPILSWKHAVTYFRPRRPGPETRIEDAVIGGVSKILGSDEHPFWIAGYLPVGAGLPDLTVASFDPALLDFPHADDLAPHVLGYLRVVGRARPDTIAFRMGRSAEAITDLLADLAIAGAIEGDDRVVSLSTPWRSILPEVVTVEAKVSNWKRAVDQALRNRLFSHRAFVALPTAQARKACEDRRVRSYGVGVLAVAGEDDVRVVRRARRSSPRLWSYYYHIAVTMVNSSGALACHFKYL